MSFLRGIFKKTAAMLTAGITAAILMPPVISVNAENEQRIIGYYGDLDADFRLTLADIRIMQNWLAGELHDFSAFPETRPEYADMDHNGRIDAVDLSIAKHLCLTNGRLEPVYETYESGPLIPSAAAQMNATLGSTGNSRIPVFVVSFPDCAFPYSVSDPVKKVQEMVFSEADPQSHYYPMESVTAYYDRASYGRMHIEGDVYRYEAESPLSYYVPYPEYLFDEILWAFNAQIDFSQYDRDGDKRIDCMIAVLPEDALGSDVDGDGQEDWWPFSNRSFSSYSVDGVSVGEYCMGGHNLDDVFAFNGTWIHELGHAMGLDDYYKYTVDAADTNQSIYGLNGPAGWEMMDDAKGDYSSFSKLMLGWLAENEVQVYTGGTQTFRLYSAQQHPSCILIPRNPEEGLLSEYFLVEYLLPESNYAPLSLFGMPAPFFEEGGIRILHCDAHSALSDYGLEFKWNNWSKQYDKSNLRQRILRLVNEAEGGMLFGSGETVNSSISGFRWYDTDGFQTVDPHLTVQIGSCFVAQDEQWEKAAWDPGNQLSDSWFSVTITDGQVNP